jgi:hypothetical protein
MVFAMARILMTVLVLFFFASAVLAQAIEGANWEEVLNRVPCERVKKNDNGSWSVAGTIIIQGARFDSPTVSEQERSNILEKHCPSRRGCAGGLLTLGVGC